MSELVLGQLFLLHKVTRADLTTINVDSFRLPKSANRSRSILQLFQAYRGRQYHIFFDIISYQYHGQKNDILSSVYHYFLNDIIYQYPDFGRS
jgi:hypothetical protein